MGKFTRLCFIALGMVMIAVPSLAGPANVSIDGGCTIGWIGCPVSESILLPDGSYTCPFSAIGIVGITGFDSTSVNPDDAHGNRFFTCTSQFEFGQSNPTGVGGFGGDVIAVDPGVVCLLFPDACKGNGAVVINPSTVGAVGVCTLSGTPTTSFQEEVTPSGQAHVACFLPDPPQGE